MTGRALIAAIVISAACGASAGRVEAATLYAPNYGTTPESVGAFATAADGSLTPLLGSPFPVSGAAAGIISFAFTPDGNRAVSTFLFDGGVQGFVVGPAGEVSAPEGPTLTPSATGLTVSPDGRFAYVPTRTFPPMGTPAQGILGFSIDPNGRLTTLADSPFSSGVFGDVAMTPDGRYLFAVGGGDVERFAVSPGGSLTDLGAPTSVSGPQFLNVSPDGRFLFVSTEGGGSDGVTSYSIGRDGGLTQVGMPAPAGGVSLDFFAVSPDGRRLYMPESNHDAIVVASVAEDGSLSVVGETSIEGVESVAVSPDGRFLYWGRPGVSIGSATIGADGLPAISPATVPWGSGEPARFSFRPLPAPVARLAGRPARPGAAASFDGSASTGAARFDWDFGDGGILADGGPALSHVYDRPGVYDVRLTVTDVNGCSTRQVYYGQSTECPGGTGAATTMKLDTLPVLGRLTMTNRRFAVRGRGRARPSRVKRGTRFDFTLSESARVALRIERRLQGRRVRGKCRRPTRANRSRRKCIRFVGATAFNHSGRAGANRVRFSGRLPRGRRLAPGPYRATALAIDAAGGRSSRQRVSFRVVRP